MPTFRMQKLSCGRVVQVIRISQQQPTVQVLHFSRCQSLYSAFQLPNLSTLHFYITPKRRYHSACIHAKLDSYNLIQYPSSLLFLEICLPFVPTGIYTGNLTSPWGSIIVAFLARLNCFSSWYTKGWVRGMFCICLCFILFLVNFNF